MFSWSKQSRIRAGNRGCSVEEWQRICNHIWSAVEHDREGRLRENEQGNGLLVDSSKVVYKAAWALIIHLFIRSVNRLLLCILSRTGSGLYLKNWIRRIPEGTLVSPASVAWPMQEQKSSFRAAKLMQHMFSGLINFAGYILGRKASFIVLILQTLLYDSHEARYMSSFLSLAFKELRSSNWFRELSCRELGVLG